MCTIFPQFCQELGSLVRILLWRCLQSSAFHFYNLWTVISLARLGKLGFLPEALVEVACIIYSSIMSVDTSSREGDGPWDGTRKWGQSVFLWQGREAQIFQTTMIGLWEENDLDSRGKKQKQVLGGTSLEEGSCGPTEKIYSNVKTWSQSWQEPSWNNLFCTPVSRLTLACIAAINHLSCLLFIYSFISNTIT